MNTSMCNERRGKGQGAGVPPEVVDLPLKNTRVVAFFLKNDY